VPCSIPHPSDGIAMQAKDTKAAATSADDGDGAERTSSQPAADAADFGAQMRAAASARRNAMGDELRRREVVTCLSLHLVIQQRVHGVRRRHLLITSFQKGREVVTFLQASKQRSRIQDLSPGVLPQRL
jgi:hypothetical protein